jgi:restriction system protein
MAVAAGMFAVTRMLLPADLSPYAVFTALPFLVIGSVAGWKQLRAPSPARIATALEELRALSADEFLAALEDAYRRDGHGVARSRSPGADLELTKAGRLTLVACRRWKAVRAGIEPLRELAAACRERDAQDGVYVSAGEITDNARAFAAGNQIRLLHDAELATFLTQPKKKDGR